MEWKRKPPFKSWSNSVVNFAPICSAVSQVTIHGLKIYWMCAMRLLAVFSPFIPLPLFLFLSQSALWHWVLSVYLFSSIIKNTATDGRQQRWLDGWQCAHSNIHTHTHTQTQWYFRFMPDGRSSCNFYAILCCAKPSRAKCNLWSGNFVYCPCTAIATTAAVVVVVVVTVVVVVVV